MKNLEVFTGKVVDVTRFDTSRMGNPRYTLSIQDAIGKITILYTQVNSVTGYYATKYYGKGVTYTSRFIYTINCVLNIYRIKQIKV